MTSGEASLEHIRKITFTYATVLLIFFLTYDGANRAIEDRAAYTDLYAWLLLKDFAASLPPDFYSYSDSRYLDSEPALVRGTSTPCTDYDDDDFSVSCSYDTVTQSNGPAVPLVVHALVPVVSDLTISLNPYGPDGYLNFSSGKTPNYGHPVRILGIGTTPKSEMPLEAYMLVWRDEPQPHFEVRRRSREYNIGYDEHRTAFLESNGSDFVPWQWERAKGLLLQHEVATDPGALVATNPELRKALGVALATAPQINVLGVPAPAALFLQILCVILLLVVLSSLASLQKVLKMNESEAASSTWVFLMRRTPKLLNVVGEYALKGASVAIVLSPFVVWYMVWGQMPDYPTTGQISGFLLNFVGAFGCVIVLAIQHLQLARLRRRAT